MDEAKRQLTISYDFSQLYFYDSALERAPGGNEYLDALDAANEAGLTVGARSGVVDVLMPRRENFAAKAAVSVLTARTPAPDDADHIVEFDVGVRSGRLIIEGSGGSGEAHVDVAPGSYRVRFSGYDFAAAAEWRYEDPDDPQDTYVLELWPVGASEPPAELRRWPRYDVR
jgi:hypothetical protein